MLGTPWTGRKGTAERTAQQAWEYLNAAVTAAGDNASWARRRGARVADEAGDRVGTAADVAWQRANAAVDALAGRRRPVPWGWIAGAAVAGLVLGAAAATAAKTVASRAAGRTPSEDTSAADPVTSAGTDLPADTGTPAIEIVDVDAPTTTPVRLDG